MNRRSFFNKMLAAMTTVAVLPSAATYGRVWMPKREIVAADMPFSARDFAGKWVFYDATNCPPGMPMFQCETMTRWLNDGPKLEMLTDAQTMREVLNA